MDPGITGRLCGCSNNLHLSHAHRIGELLPCYKKWTFFRVEIGRFTNNSYNHYRITMTFRFLDVSWWEIIILVFPGERGWHEQKFVSFFVNFAFGWGYQYATTWNICIFKYVLIYAYVDMKILNITHTHIQTDRQRDSQTARHTDRQTYKHADTHTYRHIQKNK